MCIYYSLKQESIPLECILPTSQLYVAGPMYRGVLTPTWITPDIPTLEPPIGTHTLENIQPSEKGLRIRDTHLQKGHGTQHTHTPRFDLRLGIPTDPSTDGCR